MTAGVNDPFAVHLLRDGNFAACGDPACQERFHLPNITAGEARAIPGELLEALFLAFDPPTRVKDGISFWLRNGAPHREYDLPAMVHENGDRRWMLNGVIARGGDRPAVVQADGTCGWYLRGKPNRADDKPAVVRADGTQIWRVDGENHRENDLPALIKPDGTREWFWRNKRHRVGGPAVIDASGNYMQWWEDDHCIRSTGMS